MDIKRIRKHVLSLEDNYQNLEGSKKYIDYKKSQKELGEFIDKIEEIFIARY